MSSGWQKCYWPILLNSSNRRINLCCYIVSRSQMNFECSFCDLEKSLKSCIPNYVLAQLKLFHSTAFRNTFKAKVLASQAGASIAQNIFHSTAWNCLSLSLSVSITEYTQIGLVFHYAPTPLLNPDNHGYNIGDLLEQCTVAKYIYICY